MNEERRIKDRRVSPAIGDFALQERGELLARIAELEAERARWEHLAQTAWDKSDVEFAADIATAIDAVGEKAKQPSSRGWPKQECPVTGAVTDVDPSDMGAQQPSAGVVDERAVFDAWFDQFGVGSALYPESTWQGWQARARLDQPTASAGVVVGALVSALEGIVHDERVPNEVSQDYAALLIEARRLNPCLAQAVLDLGQAATDVIAERKRQITEEGWTPGHDDRHTCGELADAAACYALWGGGSSPHNFDQFWPWGMSRLKFGQARQMLIKSGALILAEIERLDRAAAQQKESE